QYLIRGFDADHGTDLAIFVDGLPVNLRSHAHGQGYADLHFLIPETVKAVEVLKGPYFPEYGDFDTAGEHLNRYLRFKLFAKASADIGDDVKMSAWLSHYRASWNGSGEIPARAVREGLIDRFGSIDPTEGGHTQRTNVNVDLAWKSTEDQRLLVHAYASYY